MAKNSSIPPDGQGRHSPRHASADRTRSALVKASTGERSIHPGAPFVRALISPSGSNTVGVTGQSRVVVNWGWFFGALVVVIKVFMLVVGFDPTGNIRPGPGMTKPPIRFL